MRIKELVEKSGISRETIHYYSREGLLPRPKKTNLNQAEYGPEHISRLAMIKELQERFFLPLSEIKKIIKRQKKSPGTESVFKIKSDYFQPMDQFLTEEIIGVEDFLEATGMSADRLEDFEGWRIIAPTLRDGVKVYSHEDLKIGMVIGDMRRAGLSRERGFKREGLKDLKDLLKSIVGEASENYIETSSRIMTPEEARELAGPAIEMTAIFLYHLYKRMAAEEMAKSFPPATGKK